MKRLLVGVLLLASACSNGGAVDTSPAAHRVIATPEPTGHAKVTVTTPSPTAEPKPKPAVSAAAPAPAASVEKKVALPAAPVPAVGLGAFKALGAWIDVFDHTDDPGSIVAHVRGMHKQGTKTLYLESARYATQGDFQYPKAMGAALDEAKKLGMRVVAWYPPDFTDWHADVRRSVAAIEYRSPKGNRFDAFAADIEYTAGVPDHVERNKRVLQYSGALRKQAGAGYALGAIVIPPSWLERRPTRWPDFPWKQIGATYDLVMPMEYWTAIGKDTKTAYDLTKSDIQKTRALTGKPIHIIGGLGADADEAQTTAYVKAVKDGGSIGGGLYDYTSTRAEVWDELRAIN